MLALINRNLFQLHPITLVKVLKPRFLDNFEIFLLFSRKQQIFITCRWHYQIRKQRTWLPQ